MGGRVLRRNPTKLPHKASLCAEPLGSLKTRHPERLRSTWPCLPSTSSCTWSPSDRRQIFRRSVLSERQKSPPFVQRRSLGCHFQPIFTHSHLVLLLFLPLATTHTQMLFFYLGYECAIVPPAKLNLGSSSQQFFIHFTCLCNPFTGSIVLFCAFCFFLFKALM